MRKLFCLGLFAFVFLPAAAKSQTPVRVNCGGPKYTDSKGNVWQADSGFGEGKSLSNTGTITGTPDPTLFQTYHSDPGAYTFSVPDGNYQVNLYFVEGTPADEKVGARVFNVNVQGAMVFPNLDVFKEAGANTALIKTTNATVTNGSLKIQFLYGSGGEPDVSAIEVLPANQTVSGPALTLNFKYPDGTPVVGSLHYAVTSTLLSFSGDQTLTNGFVEADLFANPSAMGISAQFTVNLSLSDNSGHTLWAMNLGMNPAQVNLGAVQSSTLSVIVQKM